MIMWGKKKAERNEMGANMVHRSDIQLVSSVANYNLTNV